MNEKLEIDVIFQLFIRDFISPVKQDRLLQFLKKKKNWRKIQLEFHTSTIFKKEVLKSIASGSQDSQSIYDELIANGADTECYSLLDYLENNDFEYSLKEKLDESVGYLVETVIFCPRKGVGYFEGGHSKDRYIFKKN